MSSEDQFTSIQWDRDDVITNGSPSKQETIIEEENSENADDDDKETHTQETSKAPEEREEDDHQESSSPTQQVQDTSESALLASETNDSVDNDLPDSRVRQQDQQHLEAKKLFEQYHIQCAVSSPMRDLDSSSKPYISYLITTTTNNPSIKKLASSGDSNVNPPESTNSDEITVKVRRRYDDFRCLHECLINDYPEYLVPPLPSKLNFKYLTGDTFSMEFVHKRLNSLNRFIRYFVQHKILSQSSVFHLFLSDSADWTTFIKNLKINKIDTEEPSGFVNKVVNEDLTETLMNFLTPSKHKKETNKDILEISDRLKKLYENLIKLDKIFSRLNKRNNDLSSDYEQFLKQIAKLAVLQDHASPESQLALNTAESNGSPKHDMDNEDNDQTNTSSSSKQHENGNDKDTSNEHLHENEYNNEPNESNGFDFDTSHIGSSHNPRDSETAMMATNFKIFADSLSYFLKNWSNLHKYIDESFLVSLKDCSRYIIGLTHLIEFQHNKKIDLQVLHEYLSKTRSELSALNGTGSARHAPPTPVVNSHSGGLVNNTTQLIRDTISTSATTHIASSSTENKAAKLEARINQLENEIDLQTKLVADLTSKVINEEYPAWDRFNKNELKSSMLGLCDEQIKLYSGLIENWSSAEDKLTKRLSELST